MKKFLMWVFAVGVVAGAVVATIFLTSRNKKDDILAPITDGVFVYANLEQLAIKGAFDKFITADNRRMLATALSSQIDDTLLSERMRAVITDLNTTGIDFHGEAYGYLCDDLESFVIVAKVLNVTEVDNTIELLSHLLVESGDEAIIVEQSKDIRTFELDGIVTAYNNYRIAIVLSDNSSSVDFAKDAITRPKSDLSVFDGDDMAVMVNIERIVSLLNAQIDESITDLNSKSDDIHYSKQIEEINRIKELINNHSQYFTDGAKATISATFDLGRATLEYNAEGINYGEYATLFKAADKSHLGYLDSNAYAVMGIGVDGKILAQLVRTVLNDEFLSGVGITPTNEINMILSIVCDALSTIDGGVTLALNNIDGNVKRTYNYYWDEYSISPNIKSVEAILMAELSDTYIINNIAQFAGGFLKKVDSTHYTLRLMNYNLSMGQDDNLFHIGVNLTPEIKTPSALECEWIEDIDGAIGYFVVNIDTLTSSNLFNSINDIILKNIIDEYHPIYTGAMEAVSYIYTSAKDINSAEFVIIFDDKATNALEQINTIVLTTLMNEGIKSSIVTYGEN